MSRARSSQQWTSGDAVHRSQPPASANAGPGRGLGTLEQYGEDRLIVMGPDRAGTWLELMAMPADEADRSPSRRLRGSHGRRREVGTRLGTRPRVRGLQCRRPPRRRAGSSSGPRTSNVAGADLWSQRVPHRTVIARETPADCVLAGQRAFWRAPRVGIEPTSLILIQSQAGPASRPTGERPTAMDVGGTKGSRACTMAW